MKSINSKIFQIYYDENTFFSLDKGFIPLDNADNFRPDWFEYWPVRNYMKNNIIADDVYYGFFSPKFYKKTGLKSADVYDFIDVVDPGVDVISFSPYYDQAAFSLNIFEQANFQHPGICKCFEEVFNFFDLKGGLESCVMASNRIIFCNYFVAKKHVWDLWLYICERLFDASESGNSMLSDYLNAEVNYSTKGVQAKVFVIERVISLILYLKSSLVVKSYDPLLLPFSGSKISKFKHELSILDELKGSYLGGYGYDFVKKFDAMRSVILSGVN